MTRNASSGTEPSLASQASLRGRQGGFGVSNVSVHTSTIAADAGAVPARDLGEHPPAALVLGRVVQQTGDDLVVVAPVVDHDRRDAEQVPDVRHVRLLAPLPAVQLERPLGRGEDP